MTIAKGALGLTLALCGLAACGGGSTPQDAGGTTDSGGVTDTGTAADSGTTTDSDASTDTGVSTDAAGGDGSTAQALHGCTDDLFVDQTNGTENDRMIMTSGPTNYDFPCMTIRAGQSVMFMMSFTNHPLAPGVAPNRASDPAGTEPNPIPMVTSGSVRSVTFPTAGNYPFYCATHYAHGMYGVVRVVP